MKGISYKFAIVLAVIDPTKRDPANPGVTVAATASISFISKFDFKKTCSIKKGRFSRCLLEAISGTTPPHLACSSICEAISLANNSIFPFSLETKDAADSSQLVSRDKIIDINDLLSTKFNNEILLKQDNRKKSES